MMAGGGGARLLRSSKDPEAIEEEGMGADPVFRGRRDASQGGGQHCGAMIWNHCPCLPLQDPLNTVGNVCARTGNELLSAFRQLGTRSHEITIPLYVGHGRQRLGLLGAKGRAGEGGTLFAGHFVCIGHRRDRAGG